MKLTDLNNKKVLILGFGAEGKSSLDFLSRFTNSKIATADQKDGGDYLKKQKKYDLIIKSPGIPKKLVTAVYTTATNIFFANAKGIIIGVTGSKGKSTTSSLIHAILKKAVLKSHLVGNIGNPMLKELMKSNEPDDIFVCELSSYQLDDIKYSPHIGVFLNFFPDHMDYHGGIKNYWLAKANIAKFQDKKDFFIYNPSFPKLKILAKKTRAKAITFIKKNPFPADNIKLIGEHNKDNIRAALTVTKLFNIPSHISESVIINFKPLPHRMEFIGKYKNIFFYDDAISTTPESTIKAIESLSPIGTILLGGQDRGYEFLKLAKKIEERKIPNLVLFPDSGLKIARILKKINYQPNTLKTSDMKKAVEFAYQNTPANTVCLLSAASPSYSIWKNFEEKGTLFQKFIRKYS